MDKRKPKLLDREQLTNYAVRALGGRAHSAGELREKLSRRAVSAEDIDVVLAKLREITASDEEFEDEAKALFGVAHAR